METGKRSALIPRRAIQLLAFLLGLAPVLALFLYGAVMWRDILLLAYSGVMTDGQVVSSRQSGQQNRIIRYYLTYSLETGSPDELKTFAREREVTLGIYNRHPVGTSILVMYLPSDPKVSNIVRNDPAAIPAQRLLLVLAVFSIPVLLVFILLVVYRA